MPAPRPTVPRPLPALLLTALTGTVLALPGAWAPASAAAKEREVLLQLDRAEGGGDGASVPTGGTVATEAVLRTHGSGRAGVVGDPAGGRAFRLPAFAPGATAAPMAVVAVRPSAGASLDPGSAPFVLGASVRMDDTTTGSRADDGDNLVQRGGYADPGQMKVQVDDRRPSCRVAGADGASLVTADLRLQPDRWYDVRCRRSAWEVELVVAWHEDGSRVRRTWDRSGATGWLDLPDDVPLTVGGKVDRRGDPLAGDSDQLNGVVDDVFLDVRRG